MALLRSRYLSGSPQRQWIALCLFLLFAFMILGTGRAIDKSVDFASVQISSVQLQSADHSDHLCKPGNREGRGHIHCDCTFGPSCSSTAVIGETAAAPTGFKLALFKPRSLPLVSSEAVSHFRPPKFRASA